MPRPFGKHTLSAGIAHLNVGKQETPFDVHLELLCDCSPYFDTLFKDRTDENATTEEPICFPDDDPDVFTELVRWMYRGQLSADRRTALFLSQLWVLAEKLEVLELQDIVLYELRDGNGMMFGNETVDFVYNHTLPVSPLRQLVIDTWVQKATEVQFWAHREKFPRAFLEDFCYDLIKKKASFVPSTDFAAKLNSGPGPTSPENNRGEPISSGPVDVSVKPATAAQMANRKIKSRSSRLRRPSPASPSPSMTPVSPASNADSRGGISQDMGRLQI